MARIVRSIQSNPVGGDDPPGDIGQRQLCLMSDAQSLIVERMAFSAGN